MSVNYASNLHIGHGMTAPEGWQSEQWHASSIDDTHESHMKLARVAVVQCLWCDEVFIAKTIEEAMVMFRAHEDKMLNAAILPPEAK